MGQVSRSDSIPGDSDLVGVAGLLPREGRLLVIRRAAHIVAGGAWCFPGGAIESGETPAQAIVREMREEVGLAITPVRELGQCTLEYRSGRLEWWLVAPAIAGVYDLHPDPNEVAEARWLTRDEILELPGLLGSNRTFLRQPLPWL